MVEGIVLVEFEFVWSGWLDSVWESAAVWVESLAGERTTEDWEGLLFWKLD